MKTLVRAVVIGGILLAALMPLKVHESAVDEAEPPAEVDHHAELVENVSQYLESKDSPLAPDAEFVTGLKHWKLLIAISAIESQYCKRQLSYNCWGVGGDSAYRHYSSFTEAAQDADALITRWQERGRWHTVDDMNCHYVVPCNPTWVRTVNMVLSELNALERTATGTIAEDAK